MGSFDCYCAICGGSLTGAGAGSADPRALAQRRRRVERKRQALLAGEEPPPDSDSEASGDETEEDFDALEEEYSYDPELVSEEGLEWLEVVRGLGIDEKTNKAFLSGEGHYMEQGCIYVPVGDDEDFTKFSGYNTSDAAFPVHVPCFKLLTWTFTGDLNAEEEIDKDDLRGSFSALEGGKSLDIDHGPIEGAAQFWESIRGEEFAVTNPIEIPGLSDFLKAKLDSGTFQRPSTNRELRPNVVADPFSQLPYDVLHLVLKRLPGSSVPALATASWTVQVATHHSSFWEMMLRREMPWFWELFELLEDERYSKTGCKRLFLWLDKELSVMYGLRGPLMGIANRKRIWGPCLQIREASCNS
ncbi:hypothetical protein ASPVEDRAFT_83549 [Aspergillus versicolor CBS 583.65]|uniref:Uncharacterized protein n=1 Tax=Aspergillus versicolor CBS 583.65 TaxID=1036611 RepID=A0A1L9PKQ3_ASPVE|nr:uncharacterized protein ASPVEDRAFT_83549 [Aspergillus versicolor CBS 583.65]OJJ02026.1 hypothetical protein ASPVEDRAFT_83549 [Aspergillus versicolor CBS 583.65]